MAQKNTNAQQNGGRKQKHAHINSGKVVSQAAPLFFLRNNPKTPLKPLFTHTRVARTPSFAPSIEILASKKEFGNAIRRNRARRRIKEAWRSGLKDMYVSAPMNTNVTHMRPNLKISAKIGSLTVPFSELRSIIKKELEK